MDVLERDHYLRTLRLMLECFEALRPAAEDSNSVISKDEFEILRLRVTSWLIDLKSKTTTQKEPTK